MLKKKRCRIGGMAYTIEYGIDKIDHEFFVARGGREVAFLNLGESQGALKYVDALTRSQKRY